MTEVNAKADDVILPEVRAAGVLCISSPRTIDIRAMLYIGGGMGSRARICREKVAVRVSCATGAKSRAEA